MVRRGSIRVPKQQVKRTSRRTGATSGAYRVRVDPDGGLERTVG